ncbi:hypothetical protein GCM10012275_45600 [Longimycelium tulufanense]|uniref:DUF4229 domain-containing protein n=1 Tax=Longimycelium tulufanense TaxID=907463 RepID=A0A8J3CF52_9PSEU|nr:DUF4229 domain-containing protein [Longimycelium tulufanense]GGM70027.1 hypothetical protein GCM10012275_45600 [Longimycelium tulufanense]
MAADDVQEPAPEARVPSRLELVRDVTLYTLARLLLVLAVAGLLMLARVPLLVALAVGVVLGLPLSLLLFRGLRVRVATGLAAAGARRRAEREKLRAQLRGEQPRDEGPGAQ